MPKFSQRSIDLLNTCHPDIQKVFNEVIKHFDVVVLEGARTLETEKKYLAEGKTKTLNSKHIPDPNDPNHYSHAIDVAPYPADFSDLKRYCYLAGWVMATAESMGITMRWGGDWNSNREIKDETFLDLGHFEIK